MSNQTCIFSFKFETKGKFFELIENINYNKATEQYDILVKINENFHTIFQNCNVDPGKELTRTLYALVMSRTCFRVKPHSKVA